MMHTKKQLNTKVDAVLKYLTFHKGEVLTDVHLEQIRALTRELKTDIEHLKNSS